MELKLGILESKSELKIEVLESKVENDSFVLSETSVENIEVVVSCRYPLIVSYRSP